ncbi:MAG: class III signal peptide-containing protein, partial [Nanoarchaeota archaeon]|nr:class III signal peptide-containing protein [Nanoarchaeota archaeon]
MYNKRGQISLEYVMIVGAVLLVTIPLFFYAIYEANNKIRLNQADDAVNTLANSADTVYSLGPGSKKYVWISIPSGVESQLVSENEIMLVLSIFGGNSDIHASSKAVVVGSIPTGKGTYRISVEALEAGKVRIGEDYVDTTPPEILRVYPDPEPGQLICPGFVTLGADTDKPATCIYSDTADPPGIGSPEFDGRALTHIDTIYTEVDTTYTYYVICEDTVGNLMESSETITFSVGTPCIGGSGPGGIYGPGGTCEGRPEDYDNPEITLQSPADWQIMTFP